MWALLFSFGGRLSVSRGPLSDSLEVGQRDSRGAGPTRGRV